MRRCVDEPRARPGPRPPAWRLRLAALGTVAALALTPAQARPAPPDTPAAAAAPAATAAFSGPVPSGSYKLSYIAIS